MDWVDKPQNYKDLYGILQLLRFSHLNNFQLKTLKLGWVAFHSVTFQLKCLDFQSNPYKKLVPVLSRFCNGLLTRYTLTVSVRRIQQSRSSKEVLLHHMAPTSQDTHQVTSFNILQTMSTIMQEL